jgi:hypothetical protein
VFALAVVAAVCVTSVHMTKTAFLNCVKPYPDEYWVARDRGVPQQIEKKSTQEIWVYVKVNGREDKYVFGPGGRLQSGPKPKPTAQPTPIKAIPI